MRTLMLVAALALAAPAYALTISVPTDMPSVQAALDAAPDTILVGGLYSLAEDISIVRGVTIVGEGGGHPALGQVTIALNGAIKLTRLTFAGISGTAGEIWGETKIHDCIATGHIQVRSGRIELIDASVSPGHIVDLEGTFAHVQVTNVHVSDAPGPGITARGGEAAVWVFDSMVERCGGTGIWLPNGNGSGQRVQNNTVRDCGGDGINMDGIGSVVSGNRIERCGRGIVRRTNGGAYASDNVVLNCVGDGLITAAAMGNTVVGCGGDGIRPPAESYSGGEVGPVSAESNLVAFNVGAGIARGSGPCNLVWSNGFDSKLGATYADPQFCDLSGGDLRVSSSSPAIAGPCGQIGALGVGCPARGHIAADQDADPEVGMAPFGLQAHGRVARVTLAGVELATLDVLDVAGRRLSRTVLTSSREVRLDAPAGVVFLRLRQGERGAVVKAVVLD
jgi:hypothetical protein